MVGVGKPKLEIVTFEGKRELSLTGVHVIQSNITFMRWYAV